jgi:ceramide glucosyltransferase
MSPALQFFCEVLLSISIGFAFLSLTLTLWQWQVARRFPLIRAAASAQPYPLSRDTQLVRHGSSPGVTVLKPLKGSDGQTGQCLGSWLTQQYDGPLQILFGVADPADPVVPLVRQLIADQGSNEAQLVICADQLGPNAKVSSLIQLQRLAQYEFIIISDADILAPPDLVPELVAGLSNPEVGLVNCFYAMTNCLAPAMKWEAVAINADFWSQVLQSRTLKPMDFALGAVMATRRTVLTEIGGFEPLAGYLADDYQLGRRIFQTGRRIELCSTVVSSRSDAQGWRSVWAHQLRWARTIRVCQPGPYFLSILSNATVWPLALLGFALGIGITTQWCLSPAVGGPYLRATLGIGGLLPVICLWLRVSSARDLYRRLIAQVAAEEKVPGAGLILMKDLLNVGLWALAFLGNRVIWRGQTLRVRPGGKLESDSQI